MFSAWYVVIWYVILTVRMLYIIFIVTANSAIQIYVYKHQSLHSLCSEMYNKGLFSFYTSLMSQFHSVYTSLDIIVQSKIYSLLVVMLQYLMSVSLKQQEKAISVINLWFMTSMNTFRRVQDPSGFQCTITTYLSIKLLNTINKRVISIFLYVI